ncbi:MAG: hypothetical protein HY815_24810 [Candidatus Riflebacteria bacterium]|nr:hypothetical protein [Candidatus Riflebacteria bacterium]
MIIHAWIAGKAGIFLTASLVIGGWVIPRLFSVAARIRSEGTALVVS